MAKKTVTRAEFDEVIYNNKRWKILKKLRSKAIQIMEILTQSHIYSIIHGSVARGDVSEKSDIDIFLPNPPSSFIVEMVLERAGIYVDRRIIVQATPTYTIKAYIEIDKQQSVSFPLARLRAMERDFYKFGGEADLFMLKKGMRVPGVDKRLMLIEPNPEGHVESSIVGREEAVSNLLNTSLNTVLDRVRTLMRRNKVGRTGVFVKKELLVTDTFEMALKKLADQNPAVRRRLMY